MNAEDVRSMPCSAPESDVRRTPEWVVDEVRLQLEKIDEEFRYREGIESQVERQDAVLRLTLWAVGRLARLMCAPDSEAQNGEHSNTPTPRP